jgi:dUTP pyrophosphatase
MAKQRRGKAKKNRGVKVRLVRLAHAESLDLPGYQTDGSAGLDLVAAVPSGQPLRLKPMQRELVPTGLVVELPEGMEAQVRPRSGLALRHGITVLNSPGTIDSDYRGELKVLLINLGEKTWSIERGERIAQLVVARAERVELVAVKAVAATSRGAGGFGSTGVATNPSGAAASRTGRPKTKARPKAASGSKAKSKGASSKKTSTQAGSKGARKSVTREGGAASKPGAKTMRNSGRRISLNGHGAVSIKKGKTYPRRRQVGQRTPRVRR